MENKQFKWKIWGKKVFYQIVVVGVAGGLSFYFDNLYFLTGMPVLEAFRNYVKHS